MTPTISIVFPNQIFRDNPCLDKHRRVFIVEDDLFFSYQRFHKMKLILHRASMKFYGDYLMNQGYRVTYIDHHDYKNLGTFFKRDLSEEGVVEVHFCEPVDYLLSQRIQRAAEENNLRIVEYPTPAFMNSRALNNEFLGKEKNHYRLGDFYKKQRLHYDILIENGKPIGGNWSFDDENRKTLPKNYQAPLPNFPEENQYVKKAIEYVEEVFKDHPGEVHPFLYPVTFDEADQLMENFFTFRFNDFGPYQDALSSTQPFLNHSILSSSINCGLLTPKEVVERTLLYTQNHEIRYSSLEGFIRQLIGWREFIRAIYERHGTEQRNANKWNAHNKLNGSVFNQVKPLREVQRKVDKCAYAHHIERLMVLGNFFTLAEIHPNAVYNYFMQYYIDAYDWVMVPNVYGMSLHADGGIMSTKPYISSSNYLTKMGAKKDSEWTTLWDALYWRFVHKHKAFFNSNPRTRTMTFHLDRMSAEKLNKHLHTANEFLSLL
jgi:deoxyribodipyrimidine photolyase-related protein